MILCDRIPLAESSTLEPAGRSFVAIGHALDKSRQISTIVDIHDPSHFPAGEPDMSVKTLTAKQLAKDLNVSTRTLSRWVRDGQCPPPLWLGPGTVRFLESDVLEWLSREKLAASKDLDSAAAEVED